MSTADQLRQEETELRELRRLALQSDPSPEIPQILEETQQRLTEIRELLKPRVCQMIDFSSIPSELQMLNQWVLWKIVTRDGKERKMPFAINGKPASSTDPATWSTFAGAVEAYDPKKYSGIGFVFSPSDDFCGIDLDGCRDPDTGTVTDWALNEVKRFNTYAEISPSLTGLKIFSRSDTRLEKGRNKKLKVPPIVATKDPGVEVYTQSRFFAVTGQVFQNRATIEYRDAELQAFLLHHWPAAPVTSSPAHDWRSDDAVVERARKYVARIPGAVSGSGGHNQTFTVACRVVKGFALSKDQAFDVISEWNSKCAPPWSEHELQHKIESAAKTSGEVGYLRNANPERWDSINVPEHVAAGDVTPFLEGERVRSSDRGNIGEVVQDDGGPMVKVEFKGKDGVATLDKPRSILTSLDGSKGATVVHLNLDPFSAWDLIHKETPLDWEIIEGILRIGEVANVIASTKVGKSWLTLGLAIAVATGSRWLGRKTRKGNVLLIDNELRPATLRHRIATVMRALGIKPSADHARLEVVSLRGQFSNIQSLEKALRKYSRDEFTLIILDAKYRAFGELDENSNTDQTLFHNAVDKIAGDLNSGFIMVHHSTKGDQGGRAVTDVGSGGGSQSRAVDTHLIIRPHNDEGFAVLDAAVRSFAPVEPVTLQWDFPLWRLAQTVEPILKADKSRGDSRQEAKDLQGISELTDILHAAGEPMTRYELKNSLGYGKDRINRLVHRGLQAGRIVKVGTRETRNGEQAETFMVASRVEVQANSDEESNGLF